MLLDLQAAIDAGAIDAPVFVQLSGESRAIALAALASYLSPLDWSDVTDYDTAQAAHAKAIEEIMTALTSLPPVGTIMAWAGIDGSLLPEGWFECVGQWLLKTDYPELYAIIAGWYGENATEFRVPPIAGRVIEAENAPYISGTLRGADSITLTSGHMPAHTHAITTYSMSAAFVGAGVVTRYVASNTGNAGNTGSAGSATPTSISLRQPTFVMKYIIRYK